MGGTLAQFARDGSSMRLTNFSDYALRVLMHAAARSNRLITIEETPKVYGISRVHLMKVSQYSHAHRFFAGSARPRWRLGSRNSSSRGHRLLNCLS
jgi:hypothetical protein